MKSRRSPFGVARRPLEVDALDHRLAGEPVAHPDVRRPRTGRARRAARARRATRASRAVRARRVARASRVALASRVANNRDGLECVAYVIAGLLGNLAHLEPGGGQLAPDAGERAGRDLVGAEGLEDHDPVALTRGGRRRVGRGGARDQREDAAGGAEEDGVSAPAGRAAARLRRHCASVNFRAGAAYGPFGNRCR